MSTKPPTPETLAMLRDLLTAPLDLAEDRITQREHDAIRDLGAALLGQAFTDALDLRLAHAWATPEGMAGLARSRTGVAALYDTVRGLADDRASTAA